MRTASIFLMLLIAAVVMAQDNDFLVGEGNMSQLKQQPYKKWFDKQYRFYKPDVKTIDKLKESVWDDVELTIVMGTWCEDSQKQIPRLAQVLEELELDYPKVKLYFVDDKKKEPADIVANFEVKYVPTIVVKKSGTELGRIVEKPGKTLEGDLLKIMKKG